MLQEMDVGDTILRARVDLFSCKSSTKERKWSRTLEDHLVDEMNHHEQSHAAAVPGSSPPALRNSYDETLVALGTSPAGRLDVRQSAKTVVLLISALNMCYPDYDFDALTADDFTKEESAFVVMNGVNGMIQGVLGDAHTALTEKMWRAIDTQIDLENTQIYSFQPDESADADPFFVRGRVWTFNLFFCNKQRKRVLVLSATAVSKLSASVDALGERVEAYDENGYANDFDDDIANNMEF